MINLYIDFDGVILDTMEEARKLMIESNIDMNNEDEISAFYSNLDWKKLLEETPIINESLDCIERIIDSNIFDVSILTHVNSINEAVEKIKFIRNYFLDITIIPVPIQISKTKMVHTEESILIDDSINNLLEWKDEGGISILFSKEDKDTNFINITKLDKVIDLFTK